jgi:hypothetical protein
MFPDGVALPDGSRDADRFARAAACAGGAAGPAMADVIVVHLKSKRPDYRNGDVGDDPMLHAQANLRSLIRRGTEAVALRALLSAMDKQQRRPRVVLGDFNDTVDAVTTHIVMGAGKPASRARNCAASCSTAARSSPAATATATAATPSPTKAT